MSTLYYDTLQHFATLCGLATWAMQQFQAEKFHVAMSRHVSYYGTHAKRPEEWFCQTRSLQGVRNMHALKNSVKFK